MSTSAIQDQAMGVHPVAQSHVPRTRSRCSQPHASVDSISAGRSRHPPTARADARARGGAHRSRPTRSVARPSRPGPADAAPGLAAAVGHGRAAPTHAPTKKSSKITNFFCESSFIEEQTTVPYNGACSTQRQREKPRPRVTEGGGVLGRVTWGLGRGRGGGGGGRRWGGG